MSHEACVHNYLGQNKQTSQFFIREGDLLAQVAASKSCTCVYGSELLVKYRVQGSESTTHVCVLSACTEVFRSVVPINSKSLDFHWKFLDNQSENLCNMQVFWLKN